MSLTYTTVNNMRKTAEASDEIPIPALIGLSSLLGIAGIWGVGKYRDSKARKLLASPEHRVKTKQALAMARKLMPKNTLIATTPEEIAHYQQMFKLNPLEADTYYMKPALEEDEDGNYRYIGSYVNAPEDENGTVNYKALLHEIGHAIDYRNGDAYKADKQGVLGKAVDWFKGILFPYRTALGGQELRAWQYSGVPEDDPVRRSALDTYSWHQRTKLLDTLLRLGTWI